MKMELLLVTYRRDIPYAEFCLKSVAKFATGFSALRVVVPHEDVEAFQQLTYCGIQFPFKVYGHDDWPGQGFLCHEYQIMMADRWCPDADFIGHIDADICFTEAVTPDDYIKDGRPYLRYEPFSRIGQRHHGVAVWQDVTQRCLPFPVLNECMRAHPGVFHHGLYARAREMMIKKTTMPLEVYLKEQRNEYPQTFCEFNTLGNVAMHEFPDHYNFVEQQDDKPTPDNKLIQYWSHGSIGEPQDIWYRGKEQRIVPIEFIKGLGLHTMATPAKYVPTPEEAQRMHE